MSAIELLRALQIVARECPVGSLLSVEGNDESVWAQVVIPGAAEPMNGPVWPRRNGTAPVFATGTASNAVTARLTDMDDGPAHPMRYAGPIKMSRAEEAKPKPKTRKVLSVRQIAERLGISEWSVIRRTKKGDMPYLAISPRRLMFDPVKVDEWVAAGMPTGVSEPRVTCTRRVKPKGQPNG